MVLYGSAQPWLGALVSGATVQFGRPPSGHAAGPAGRRCADGMTFEVAGLRFGTDQGHGGNADHAVVHGDFLPDVSSRGAAPGKASHDFS